MKFPTNYTAILERLNQVDPVLYGKTRNYLDGAVTYLSPYISRGVLSTKQIYEWCLDKGFEVLKIEKFIQELAWRDYWQQVWVHKQGAINSDLRRIQPDVQHHQMPSAILDAETDIEAIDQSIQTLYETGYMHNHARMYVASICCNIAGAHWHSPAQWMYYHLLDADWASNALSWQWVAGANSNKKYYANQSNINKYCNSTQQNSFLSVPYADFEHLAVPKVLQTTQAIALETPLPTTSAPSIDNDLPTCIYTFYNLDPKWRDESPANRILLLEPSVFEAYPIGQKSIDFMLGLAKNIPNLQVYSASFEQLQSLLPSDEAIYFKEHPLNTHFKGIEDARDWMSPVEGYMPSFFKFWKKVKRSLEIYA